MGKRPINYSIKQFSFKNQCRGSAGREGDVVGAPSRERVREIVGNIKE